MCTYYLIVTDIGDSILLHSLISGDQDSPQKEVSGDPVEAEADNQKGIRMDPSTGPTRSPVSTNQ